MNADGRKFFAVELNGSQWLKSPFSVVFVSADLSSLPVAC